MTERVSAVLVLEDGTVHEGVSCGARGTATGVLTFDTTGIGYLEVLTDPASVGRITMFTYPQIGNYGVALADASSGSVYSAAVVVREMCEQPSNFRSELSLPEFLREQGIVAIEGIDTRALTLHLRDSGSLRAVVSTEVADREALVSRARDASVVVYEDVAPTPTSAAAADSPSVAVIDCGVTRSVLDHLGSLGYRITVHPASVSAQEIIESRAVGAVFAGGPGHDLAESGAISACRELIGHLPILGIGSGLEVIGCALGAEVVELKRGHHGASYPVKELASDRTSITSQNRGFALDPATIGTPVDDAPIDADGLRDRADAARIAQYNTASHGPLEVTHINLNDGVVEGIALSDHRVRGIGYAPLAQDGPNDASAIWTWFANAISG